MMGTGSGTVLGIETEESTVWGNGTGMGMWKNNKGGCKMRGGDGRLDPNLETKVEKDTF